MNRSIPCVADLGTPCHVGIVVRDLGVAKAQLEAMAGHRWADTFDGEMPILVGDQQLRLRTRVAWSVQGPCHLELIEAVPDTLWAARSDLDMHHVGYWVDDIDTVSRQLEARGIPVEVRFDNGSEVRDVFVYHRRTDGLRIELGGEQQRNLVRSSIAECCGENGQETDSG